MFRFLFAALFLVFIGTKGVAQSHGPNLLLELMEQASPKFDSVLKNKEQYRLQILYTKVDRDDRNEPHFTTYVLDTSKYFYYCASMIKLMEIPLALEKINSINKSFGVTRNDSLVVSGDPCGDQNEMFYRAHSNLCSPALMIKDMLLISNNHAFNPLYDLITQAQFNKRAHQLGYNSVVVTNRFMGCDSFQNRIGSSVVFYDRATGKFKYLQPASFNPEQPRVTRYNTTVGNGFLNSATNKIDPPKDFAYNNFISLPDLHRLLIHLIFPQSQHKKHRFNLTPDDYAFIHKYMGLFPRESVNASYDTVLFSDKNMKFFITPTDTFGHAPKNLRVFNKIGQAYGFTTDCSYIIDTEHKVEFFLSVSMYTNKDGILNDGVYEYETVALPFFRNLFSTIYDYELYRTRKHQPVFENYNFTDTAR